MRKALGLAIIVVGIFFGAEAFQASQPVLIAEPPIVRSAEVVDTVEAITDDAVATDTAPVLPDANPSGALTVLPGRHTRP